MRKINMYTGLIIVLLSAGCYYDKEEILYPAGTCNSAGATYSGIVSPILNSRCNSCHGSAVAASNGGNIVLDNYNSVKIQASNGKLLGSINHAGGFSPMPKSGAKLTSCEIASISNWTGSGAPNN